MWRTSFRNGLFLLLYQMSVPPATLHRWYYRREAPAAATSEKIENKSLGVPL